MSGARRRGGFSLVELLAAVAILAILAALALPLVGAAQAAGDRSKAMANMRAIGTGIVNHAIDKDGLLPGPLWPGQVPEFDPTRAGRLVRELAPYLGYETPTAPAVVDLFVPPAYRKKTPAAALRAGRTYVVNMAVSSGNTTINPWGSSVPPNDGSRPRRFAEIPSGAWGFSDADRLHPRVISASWAANTPAAPVHGKRLAWFFNGSVAPVEEEILE